MDAELVRKLWLMRSDKELGLEERWELLSILRVCVEKRLPDAAMVLVRCIDARRVTASDVWEFRLFLGA